MQTHIATVQLIITTNMHSQVYIDNKIIYWVSGHTENPTCLCHGDVCTLKAMHFFFFCYGQLGFFPGPP